MLEEIFYKMKEIEDLKLQIENKKEEVSNLLYNVVQIKGKSFIHKNQRYQIRQRSGKYYLCTMNKSSSSSS